MKGMIKLPISLFSLCFFLASFSLGLAKETNTAGPQGGAKVDQNTQKIGDEEVGKEKEKDLSVEFKSLRLPLQEAALISFKLKTRIEQNESVEVCYRLPQGYDEAKNNPRKYRLLLYFGGRNSKAQAQAIGPVGFDEWADKNKIVIVGIGLTNQEYWKIENWSGKVIASALSRIAREHRPIYIGNIFVAGYSAGSQASNSFAATFPTRTLAWMSVGCGVWHEPTPRLKDVPGLIITGDVDANRYLISRAYYQKYLRAGYRVIWKSLNQTGHIIDREATGLASAFFDHYNKLYERELVKDSSTPSPMPRLASLETQFIGDDNDGVFYPLHSPSVANIPEDERVYLPSREVAEAWGKARGIPQK